ncbi:MAG: GAF domain-containing protein [bacterium]|nr:GAF domain-containing protein [bacterium]
MENIEHLITEEVKFNVLTEVCTFVNSTIPYEQQLQSIVEAANKLLGVKDSSLIILDEETQLLHFHIVTGEKSQQLESMTMKPGEGIAGWVAEQGKPLVVPDVSVDPRFNQRISDELGFETRSILCVPIRVRDRVFGSFEAVNRLDGRPFEEKNIPLLTAFASLVGVVLENFRVKRLNEESKLALENLVQTKASEVETVNKDLAVKTQRLALTTKIVSLINSNRSMTDILVEVAKQLQHLIPLDYTTVALLQDNRSELLLLELLPLSESIMSEGLKVPFDESVIKYVVQYKRSIFHNRPRWYRCFLEEGRFLETQLSTMLCMPVVASDTTVLGSLNLGCIERHHYAKEAVDIVTFIAKQLGVAFERKKLRSSLEDVNQKLNEKTFELRRNLTKMGDANLRLFNTQQELREKDKSMKTLLHEVQNKNEELNETLEELKQTQTQLVQSEKMASLGQLVAGIAHELNTPAGAIKAASEVIPDYIQKTFQAYETLRDAGISLEHRQQLLGLIDVMSLMAKDRQRHSTATIREKGKALMAQLAKAGVPNCRAISRDIARCYLESHLETLLTLFAAYGPEAVMGVLNNCNRVLVSSRDSQMSAETISKIVRALKSYSYLDQSQVRTVDLNEDIENTLTILHSQIPDNITIVKQLKNIPEIQCLGSELNQVWTNIIQNALQAFSEDGGTICVETLESAHHISVKITDDGPGIPDKVKSKIFDPFFTTKRGKTNGLGLSITQQIVDKHNGSIRLNSVPGETSFEVILPKKGIILNQSRKRKTTMILEESE